MAWARPSLRGDGRHIDYLMTERGRRFGTATNDMLRDLLCANGRTLVDVDGAGVLPSETVFFSPPLSWPLGTRSDARKVFRQEG
jgi:hypothetical protein